MAYESDAEPIKVGYLMDFKLPEFYPQEMRDDLTQPFDLVFSQGLAAIADENPDVVDEIRGRGLMLGIKCRVPNLDLFAAMREERLLSAPAGENVVRLLPPLTVTAEEARDGLSRIGAAARRLSKELN